MDYTIIAEEMADAQRFKIAQNRGRRKPTPAQGPQPAQQYQLNRRLRTRATMPGVTQGREALRRWRPRAIREIRAGIAEQNPGWSKRQIRDAAKASLPAFEAEMMARAKADAETTS